MIAPSPPALTLISVCICTFRRSSVAETLLSLGELILPPETRIEVVVADNDREPSARETVEAAARKIEWPVHYVHAPAANISVARNACLDSAQGEMCAFIDDDETATPVWLSRLVAVMQRDAADAVLGPVRAVYAEGTPSWMRDHDFHSTYPVVVKGTIRTGYTCNVLIDRRSQALRGLSFDLSRGRSGGEDTEFFTRLHLAGGRISYADDAWVEEPVPSNRARFKWLAARRYRMGQT
uniref:glycosyltransferase n=1 Tax=Paracoccus sp. TaxID=267 RepID=UPI00396CC6AB